MLDILHDLGNIVQDIILDFGYLGIIFVMFLENVFPPIPSELVLPFAGFQVAEGHFNLILVWVSSIIGSLLGAIVLYYIGQWAGEHVVRQFLRRFGKWFMLSEADYDRALRFFDQYGEVILFTGRLMPIIRSLISIPAGADRMPLGKFLLYTTLGSALWNGILIGAGWQLGENWERVMDVVAQYQNVVIVVVVLAVLAFVAHRIWVRFIQKPPDDSTQAAPGS
jgi:membrane protein DedA with SNARE-associated domain